MKLENISCYINDKIDNQPLNPFTQSIYAYDYKDVAHVTRMLVVLMEYNGHTRINAFLSDGRTLWLDDTGAFIAMRYCTLKDAPLKSLRTHAHSGKLIDINSLTQNI